VSAEDVVFSTSDRPGAAETAALFRSAGLNRPVHDLDRIERMIGGANLIVTARLNGKLVGIARSITDFSYACYLSDLAVDGLLQKQGIGRNLIAITREQLGPEVMLLLLSAPGAMSYYPRAGFTKNERAFWIERER
jgi:GNAT superfamily N-acetyltransferase